LVPQGYQVEMVVLEKEDSKERGENLDHQEVEALQVLRAHRVLQVFLVPKWKVRLFLDLLVHLDHQEMLDLQVPQDPREVKEHRVTKERLVPGEIKVNVVQQDCLE